MLTNKKIIDIKSKADSGMDFEVKFIDFLNIMGYMGEDIFNEKYKSKITQYRNEFIKGYNHGYK